MPTPGDWAPPPPFPVVVVPVPPAVPLPLTPPTEVVLIGVLPALATTVPKLDCDPSVVIPPAPTTTGTNPPGVKGESVEITSPPPPPAPHHLLSEPAPAAPPPPTATTQAFVRAEGTCQLQAPTVVNDTIVSPFDAVVDVGLHATRIP